MLKELVEDDIEQLALMSQDTDAKIGHKTADTAFFGYKTHLAMTKERGDAAYSEKENNINLVSKLSKTVTHIQSNRTNPNVFEFNKMPKCMSVRLDT